MAGEVMAESFPPELSGLLDSRDALSKEEAWQRFVNRHSRLLLTTARETCADYDDGMERYAFLLDELKQDDFRRLRKYLADGRGKFTTWLVVVARRLCVDHRPSSGYPLGLNRRAMPAADRRVDDPTRQRRWTPFGSKGVCT